MIQQAFFGNIQFIAIILSFMIMSCTLFARRKQIVSFYIKSSGNLWERSVAFIIDLIVCYIILYLLSLIQKNVFFINLNEKILDFNFFIIYYMYFVLLESSKMQSTIGKYFERIIVVDINGGRISFFRASVRLFANFVSLYTLLFGYILIFFTKDNQCLHDIISNTLVIKK